MVPTELAPGKTSLLILQTEGCLGIWLCVYSLCKEGELVSGVLHL